MDKVQNCGNKEDVCKRRFFVAAFLFLSHWLSLLSSIIIKENIYIVKHFLDIFLYNHKVFLDIINVCFYTCLYGGDDIMDTSKKIKLALAYLGVSEAELARRVGATPQAFNQRMKTGKWSDDDLNKIAGALGCEIAVEFRFPDGTTL